MQPVLPAVSYLGIMPHVGKHAQNTNVAVPGALGMTSGCPADPGTWEYSPLILLN